jgi:predicted enzyme related to lactoylglutathione lyase
MLRGLTTVSFYAADLEAAKRWYTELLGIEPYFSRDGYAEFRVGDFQHELGLIDERYRPPQADQPGGAIVYWAVDDLQATLERLLSMGATVFGKPAEHGPGFVTASVIDPFGNLLGIMYNQHYLDIAARLVP